MFKSERKLGVISLTLICVMVFALLFNVLSAQTLSVAPIVDNVADNASETSTAFESSDLDLSSLSQQFINQELAQQNVASYDGEQWVIVELEGSSLMSAFKASGRYSEFKDYLASEDAKRVEKSIQKTQQDFLRKLDSKGLTYVYKYSYATLNNGVALKVDADTYNVIKGMSGVKDVYYSEHYATPKYEAVTNNANVYTTGIYNTEKLKEVGTGYQGEGMVVAILDTGLDYTHPAFTSQEGLLTNARMQKEDLAEILSHVNADGSNRFYAVGGVDDLYYSEKIPFGYDYAEDTADIYPAFESHGTHVAGIVAGYDPDKVVNADVDPVETFKGVAPQAQLAIMKVFTDDLENPSLGGANSVDILRALNDCVTLGVDVINMSLGTSAGFADGKSNNFLNNIYQMIEDEGISLVVAASNDYSSGFGGGNGTNLASNPDSGTVGAPSTYQAALSVASINGYMSKYIRANESDGQIAFITNSSDQYSNEIDFIEELYKLWDEKHKDDVDENGEPVQRPATLRYKYVLINGIGAATNYTAAVKRMLANKTYQGKDVDGTIALVKRGTSTFAEKVQAAMDAGADAVVIYNNVSGVIRMSLGEVEDPIPACSITMDAANIILANTMATGEGLFEINNSFEAGPFMSDFSSWGPTPSLQLKPEITAHGGEITSAVGGNAYNIYSGTSMASPNMAGAVAILRQYVQEQYPSLKGQDLEARLNQLLMSTATIARNEEGNPYSPRKQGAGLANILNAVLSEGYIYVRDGEGGELDKTKLELWDDPTKEGVYTLNFVVKNTSSAIQTYAPKAYVMTETMASDNKTVAEKAFMFGSEYADVQYFADGQPLNGNVTVQANDEVDLKVIITLKDAARQYLDKNFVNGMYVEGFVALENTAHKDADQNGLPSGISLSIPFLAFYGDWNQAPLFDYDVYDIAESEQDTNVPAEEKLKASAAATEVVGLYYNDEMLLPMGTYIYNQDESEVQVYPSRDKIAVSMFDTENDRTIYEVYCVWAGLLRGAGYVDIVIANHVTGEIIYEYQLENIAKSYAGGGSNRGAFIDLALKPADWGMQNNESFDVYVKGQLDYKNGGDDESSYLAKNPNRGEWSFTFTADYESPQLRGYRVRYLPYTEYGVQKYRIYLDLDVYDNQYVMDVLPAYIGYSRAEQRDALTMLTEYPVPVQGERNSVTTVSFEITDYYDELVETGDLYVQLEDYALNGQTYRIILGKDSLEMPAKFFLEEEGNKFVHPNGRTGNNNDGTAQPYDIYQLTIQPNEVYRLNSTEQLDKYTWVYADQRNDDNAKVLAKGAEIFGKKATDRPVILYLTSGENTYYSTNAGGESITHTEHIYAAVEVYVTGPTLPDPRPTGIKFKPIYDGNENIASPSNSAVELNPNMEIQLEIEVTPWYCSIEGYTYTSSNATVATVSDSGLLTTSRRGSATITARAKLNTSSLLTTQFTAVVGSEFEVTNYTLYNYYGGPEVIIPDDLNIMSINEYCFRYNTEITRVVLPSTLTSIPEFAFVGCTNLREITIPGLCQTIYPYAFYGCESLERIILPNFVDGKHVVQDVAGQLSVGDHAFDGCIKLKDIAREHKGVITSDAGWERITALYNFAFTGCTSLEMADISALRVCERGVFTDCTSLSTVIMSPSTVIGDYMFDGCTSLDNVTYESNRLPNGVFRGTTKLKKIKFTTGNLLTFGMEAFKNSGIEEITLPGGSYTLGAEAFADCANLKTVKLSQRTELRFDLSEPARFVSDVTVSPFGRSTKFVAYAFADGSSDYYEIDDGVLYSTGKATLVNVPIGKEGFSLEGVTKIGPMAVAGVKLAVEELDLTGVTEIGAYAFAQSDVKRVKLPTELTKIPDGAFMHCKELVAVEGLERVTEVGEFAFALSGKSVSDTTPTFNRADLSATTTIGAYAFYYSYVQEVANAGNVKSIGDYAFAYSKLRVVNMPAADKVGNFAFAYGMYGASSVSEASTIESAGISSIHIGPVTEMGVYAFAFNNALTDVTIAEGATAVAAHAFEGNNVPIYEIDQDGNPVLVGYTRNAQLKSVRLPNTVKEIGESAFEYNHKLESINLGSVTTIGDYAFDEAYALTTGFDLSSATEIGDFAFLLAGANAGYVNIGTLSNATHIGNYAFAGTNVSGELNLANAEYIGEMAFADSYISKVTLSQNIGDHYVYRWYDYDEKGFVDNRQDSTPDDWSGAPRARYLSAIGSGAFAECPNLTSIVVSGDKVENMTIGGENVEAHGNGVYFSADGVLYSKQYTYTSIAESEIDMYTKRGAEIVRLNDRPYAKQFAGYRLEQFPARWGKDSTYSIADGTLSVRAHSFEGVSNLLGVTLPNTVKEIGDAAFFNTSIEQYEFLSIEAPTLLSDFDATLEDSFIGYIRNSNCNFMPDDMVEANSPNGYRGSGFYIYYAAFADTDWLLRIYQTLFRDPDYIMSVLHIDDFGMTAIIPKNGTGYDAPLWGMFFGKHTQLSENNLPSAQMDKTVAAINALPSPEAIREYMTTSTLEQIKAPGGIMEQIRNARELYNNLTDPVQVALAGDINVVLENAEAALRDVKKFFGEPAKIVSVSSTGTYNTNYQSVSDRFDPTGLTIRVLFDDQSEIKVNGDSLTFSPITEKQETFGDGFVRTVYVVTSSWTYEGTTYPIEIVVNVDTSPSGGSSGGDNEQPGDNELSKGAIIGIAVGAAAAVMIAAVAVVLVLLKKKGVIGAGKAAKGASEQDVQNVDEQAAQSAEEQAADVSEQASEDVEQGAEEQAPASSDEE